MELYFYIAMVAILVLLATSALMVGVANDAVNFLNSAVGAKAAPIRVILITAAAGVMLGAISSDGMMEIARSGIFNPSHFYFNEIMLIFLAVMLTDVILLDLFNTFGLPTSTTVSIIFELLGAAVGMSIIKIASDPTLDASAIGTYINSGKTLVIISGILLSVVLAFITGSIFQYFTRIVFSFNTQKTIKYCGSVFGGLAITAITHFLLIKGAKGSSLITEENYIWIKENSFLIVLYSFIGWTILLQLAYWIFNANILKIVVLAGTFALAMAFAGNDLVNFIGVPLAGINAFKEFVATGATAPNELLMTALAGKVKTPTLFLVIAGLIMVITIWTNKKARSVIKTSLKLSNQDDVDERFESSRMARSIVRGSISLGQSVRTIVPKSVFKVIDKRFDNQQAQAAQNSEDASFDLIRATVNLLVASVLISIATSYKLPLSTTYVTFMVAMGSSFADGAWNRERAVYRVTGVITIIGGWFFTAISAFIMALAVALFIAWGEMYAIILVLIVAGIAFYKSQRIFRQREKEEALAFEKAHKDIGKDEIYSICSNAITQLLSQTAQTYSLFISALATDKRKKLKESLQEAGSLNSTSKSFKKEIPQVLRKFGEESYDLGHYYVEIIDYAREAMHSLHFMIGPAYKHVDNNHLPVTPLHAETLLELADDLKKYIERLSIAIEKADYTHSTELIDQAALIIEKITKWRKKHVKTFKKSAGSTRTNLLVLDILNETKNLVLNLNNTFKSFRDFDKQFKSSIINKIQ